MAFSPRIFLVTYWRHLIVAATVLLIGWYFFGGRADNPGATLTVTRGDFKQQVNVSGTVIAAARADLGFAANGRVAGTFASVGQHVDGGALLAQTENGDLVADLEQANANLTALLSGTRPEELAVASAAVESATRVLIDAIRSAYTVSDDAVHNKVDTLFNAVEAFSTNPPADLKLNFRTLNDSLRLAAEHDRATIGPTLSRWASLLPTLTPATVTNAAAQAQSYMAQVSALLADVNAALNQGYADQTISAATLASYATTLATARAAVNSAATTLTNAAAALDTAQKNLTLKQAGATKEAVAAQRAAVDNAAAALAKTRIVAPFSGIVTRMDAKVGEVVSPSSPLVSMQSDGIFQIETFVPEVSVAGVAAGNAATITLDAYGPYVVFSAKVISVDPAETVKDGVPTYKTVLSFTSPDARIRSGMTANVIIETGILRDVIVVPAGAVVTKGAQSYVSVVSDGSVESRSVTVGPAPALGQAHILSGLSSGEVILFTPLP